MPAGKFLGLVTLGDTLKAPVQTESSNVPTQADAAPRRQVYGPDAAVINGVGGQGAQMHTGSVTGATNANPIVITSTAHGLQTGARVKVQNVGGNTNANTVATVTKVNDNSFSLDGVAGNSAYTSGGDWMVAGLYYHSIVCSTGNGFEAGKTYFILSTWAISTSARGQMDSFTVV